MEEYSTPICPIPGIGLCVGERCNYWDPERGCIGAGICFDSEPPREYSPDDLFDQQIVLLSCYEDPD